MCRNKRCPHLTIFSFLIFTPFFCSVLAKASGVTGQQSASYRFSPPATILPYENAGYRISESTDGAIHVSIDAKPLKNKTPYPVEIRNKAARKVLQSGKLASMPAGLSKIERQIVRNCHGYVQAVTSILSWVSEHFHYRLSNRNTLEGNCTAAAELTVQLLSLAGIPARKTTGVVLTGKQRVLSGRALHSFVEIYYPGTGWLFSDPLASYHFVPASYVLLNDAPASDYFGLTLTCVEKSDSLRPVITRDDSKTPGRINLFRFN